MARTALAAFGTSIFSEMTRLAHERGASEAGGAYVFLGGPR